MSRTAPRAAGALGVTHVVLVIGGFAMLVTDHPLKDASDAGLTAYFVDGPMTQILTGGYIQVAGFLCFLPFAVALGPGAA